eukprot:285163_1
MKQQFEYFPTYNRLYCKLLLIQKECILSDTPYYINHNFVSGKFKCPQMRNAVFRSALENAGYQWSVTHCTSDATKTNAPFTFVLDIFKAFLIQNDVNESNAKNDTQKQLLSQELFHKDKVVNFTVTRKAQNANKDKLYKLPPPNWGPKKSAKQTYTKRKGQEEDNDGNHLWNDVLQGDKKGNDDEDTITFKHRRRGSGRGRGRGR